MRLILAAAAGYLCVLALFLAWLRAAARAGRRWDEWADADAWSAAVWAEFDREAT